jgi:hypothetical protein
VTAVILTFIPTAKAFTCSSGESLPQDVATEMATNVLRLFTMLPSTDQAERDALHGGKQHDTLEKQCR